MLAAALALAATLAVTGCLHEDGLADTADGFGGGRYRERKLDIMRDSRLGTYGACALMMSLILRWTARRRHREPDAGRVCAGRGPRGRARDAAGVHALRSAGATRRHVRAGGSAVAAMRHGRAAARRGGARRSRSGSRRP